eukprot:TRINITY_DN54157_c0_g1_i1.p1 TRINITY_DN54157_c0_g1~~TRINITY_DN54157_c0_g1_i1.p1  ORF type:complete len:411 (-),score=70.01 TRINITY_DN54157_c0_g1_i1:403-1599(-)
MYVFWMLNLYRRCAARSAGVARSSHRPLRQLPRRCGAASIAGSVTGASALSCYRNSASRRHATSEASPREADMTGGVSTIDSNSLEQANELAQLGPEELQAAEVQDALRMFSELNAGNLRLTGDQHSVVAQQLLRTLLSYQHWLLPTALRDDLPSGPSTWYVGLPSPGSKPGGPQILPLCSDEAAFKRLTGRGVKGSGNTTVTKTVVAGVAAMSNYLFMEQEGAEPNRLEGIVMNAGDPDNEVLLGKEKLGLLRSWEATLRLEGLLAKHPVRGADGGAVPPASDELAELLRGPAKLYFVRMGNVDLARDGTGKNYILITSADAAALCAAAYGRQQLRPVEAAELRDMASKADGAFGYALTIGPDRAPVDPTSGARHVPSWHTRVFSAEWIADALSRQL